MLPPEWIELGHAAKLEEARSRAARWEEADWVAVENYLARAAGQNLRLFDELAQLAADAGALRTGDRVSSPVGGS